MNNSKTVAFVLFTVLSAQLAVAETFLTEAPAADTPAVTTTAAQTSLPVISTQEIVQLPTEQEGYSVYNCDSEGNPHYAYFKKSATGFVLIHDGKEVVSFDALFDKAPTLSHDGKNVACWVRKGGDVVLFEGNKGIIAIKKAKLGDCNLFATPSGGFIAKYSIETGRSFVSGLYRYHLYQTFVISGAEKWGPFGRASIHIPAEGESILVLATKSRGANPKNLEKGITEWILLRDGKPVNSWPTKELLDVPSGGILFNATSDLAHYICALRISRDNWQVIVDGKAVDTFDGAMVGTPTLCAESPGNNRIVTATLSISDDGNHWAYWRITPSGVKMVLNGKYEPWCNGWYALNPVTLTSQGRVMPFMAMKAVEQDGTGLINPYSKEWNYKWGVYTGEETLAVDSKLLPPLYGNIKLLVASEENKHYAYAGLKGELTGVTLFRAGYSQNFEGAWHVVRDSKEERPWSDIRALVYLPGTTHLAAITSGLKDKSEERDKVFVILDGTSVASHEWAWGLQAEAGSFRWFSRKGKKIFLNRFTIGSGDIKALRKL